MMGYRPTLKYIEDHYGEGWEVDNRPSSTASQFGFAEADDSARQRGKRMSDRLEEEAVPGWDALMEPVRRLVETADSLEQIRDGILDLYEDMPSDQLAKVLQKAIATAELAGRADVSEGA